jgi:hypothetical protein
MADAAQTAMETVRRVHPAASLRSLTWVGPLLQ